MNRLFQKFNHDNPTMNRKERREAKRSKRRKAAIAMIAAGLLALSPTVSTDVFADASDDLVIYGGGGGGTGGSAGNQGGGGGGYVGYGDAFIFAGGASYDFGGGVGGGGGDLSPGGGNYLHNWGGILNGSGKGPNGISGSLNAGAPASSNGAITIGSAQVSRGGGINAHNGGNAQLSLTGNIAARDIEILAGDSGWYFREYLGGTGGDAKLLAADNQITVHGNVVIASGKNSYLNENGVRAFGGSANVDVNDFNLTGKSHDFEVFNANDNLDVNIGKFTLENGANLNAKFINSIESTDIKGIHFKGNGKVTFTIEGTGSFLSIDSYKSIITTDNNMIPSIELSNQNKTLSIAVADPPAPEVKSYAVTFNGNKGKIKKNGKYKSTKLTKKYTYGNKYGTLPKVKRTGYKFKGWYTKKSGGKKITSKSTMTFKKNTTLYARWTPNAKVANCKTVNLRKAAGKPKVVKANVKKGTKVAILKTVKVSGKGKWYKVKVGSKTGYMQTKYVKRIK